VNGELREREREEPRSGTSGCSNGADGPTAGRAEEERGMEKCGLLEKAGAYRPQLDNGGEE